MSMDQMAEMIRTLLGTPKHRGEKGRGGCSVPGCPIHGTPGTLPTGGKAQAGPTLLDTDGAISHIRAGGGKPVYLMAVTPSMEPCEVGPLDPDNVIAALELTRATGTPTLAVSLDGQMALAALLHPVQAGDMNGFVKNLTELALEAKKLPKLDEATWLMATASPASLETEDSYRTSSLGELLARLSGESEDKNVYVLIGSYQRGGRPETLGHALLGTVGEVRRRFPADRPDDPVYLCAEAGAREGIAIDANTRIDREVMMYRALTPQAGPGVWIPGIKTSIPGGRARTVTL